MVTIAADPAMRQVLRLIERVAPSHLSVLLTGETGVGKEVCAELLHQASARAGRGFVRLNCAALPPALLESELFGYERGAFTGAAATKPGLIDAAAGGTLFLDEIGELALETQAKLLRAVETQQILRLGATQARRIDFRLVAATNVDLPRRVAEGRFRSDLYYRLNGITIVIPPLRARRADIEPLARAFLRQTASPAPELSPSAIERLRAHDWPGNVRELKNVVERAAILCEDGTIEPQHFHIESNVIPLRSKDPNDLIDEIRSLEDRRILDALRTVGGNQHAAARMLGISRGSLRRRIARMSSASKIAIAAE